MPAEVGQDEAGASLGVVLAIVRAALHGAGLAEPGREARLLIERVAGIPATAFVAHPDLRLSVSQVGRVQEALGRRCRSEPLSRIVGSRSFYGREFAITPAVLDPRPETETIVETVLDHVRSRGGVGAPCRILDIGVGSGAILLSLLAESPGATGVGTDVSAEAIEVARRNAERLGVADRASFRLARSLDGVDECFDIVVSNPPYIPSKEIAGLAPEVRAFDPLVALDGGVDGFDVYTGIAEGVSRIIGDGLVAVEAGAGQADSLLALIVDRLGAERVISAEIVRDLGGIGRCVAVRTRAIATR